MTTRIQQNVLSALILGSAFICVSIFTNAASAQCGTQAKAAPNALRVASSTKLAGALRPELPVADTSLPSQAAAEPSIVGLWDQRFIVGGQLYDEALDQLHADGNEVAIDIVPPIAGNVCVGIWKKAQGARTYNVMHPFWVFDPATNTILIGRGLITETITLDKSGNKFTGTFKITFRDVDGNPLPGFSDSEGDLIGDRIDM